MSNYDASMLTSAYKPWEYIDQHANCLLKWQSHSYAPQVEVVVGFVRSEEIDRQEETDRLKKCDSVLTDVARKIGIGYQSFVMEKAPYSTTINLLIDSAKGRNLGILNIDDYRDITAIQNQVLTLRSDAVLTYGDYMAVGDMKFIYDEQEPEKISRQIESTYDLTKQYNTSSLLQMFKWGPFITWNASLHKAIGYYDENLTCACDYDWINRIISYQYPLMRTPGIMGCFLSAGKGLSTRPDTAGHRENAFVMQRYFNGQHEDIVNFGQKINWKQFRRYSGSGVTEKKDS